MNHVQHCKQASMERSSFHLQLAYVDPEQDLRHLHHHRLSQLEIRAKLDKFQRLKKQGKTYGGGVDDRAKEPANDGGAVKDSGYESAMNDAGERHATAARHRGTPQGRTHTGAPTRHATHTSDNTRRSSSR